MCGIFEGRIRLRALPGKSLDPMRLCKPGESPRLKMAPPEGTRLTCVWVQGSRNIDIKLAGGWTILPNEQGARILPAYIHLITEPVEVKDIMPAYGGAMMGVPAATTKGKRKRITR